MEGGEIMGNLVNKIKVVAVDSVLQLLGLVIVYNGFVAGAIQQPTVGVPLALGSFIGLFLVNGGLSILKEQAMYKKYVMN